MSTVTAPDLFNSRSMFSTTVKHQDDQSYVAEHLHVFAHQWLPQMHPELDPAFTQQPLSLVAELYPAIYLYGPQGERWLQALNTVSKLLNDDMFITDLYNTFNDIFDIYAGNYRVDQGKHVQNVLSLMSRLDSEQHLGGSENLITDLFDGLDTQHVTYQLYTQIITRTQLKPVKMVYGDEPVELSFTADELRQTLIFFSYYYLTQHVFANNSFLADFTTNQQAFLTRWAL